MVYDVVEVKNMAKKKPVAKRRVITASLSAELAKRLQDYANSHALTTSATVNLCVKQYLDSEELKPTPGVLSKAFTKIADTGKLDAETTKQIQAFDTLIKLTGDGKKW